MSAKRNESELAILHFWEDKKIAEKLNQKNKSNELFNFVEGPPFPTGDAHLGHLRNWAIKDSVFRFRRLQGYNVYARDGYDVHGLPVEQKVQEKLGIKDTKELKESFGVSNFLDACRKYVDEVIHDMKGVRKRYGLSMDLNQWQTSHPEYISMAWRFFKKADEKGLLYKDYKCVAWSPALETTLSDYEVKDSYAELEDPSVYVRFKVRKEDRTTEHDEYLLIWTTTPWTLEANQAIAVNKHFNYAKVLIQDEKESYVIIVGEALVAQVVKKLSKTQNIKSHKIVELISGVDLVGIHYEHIYPENPTQKELAKDSHYHRVLHADFVSLGEGESHIDKLEKKNYKHSKTEQKEEEKEVKKKVVKEGTGLAHEAPAHGMEDFELCRSEGLKRAYCVVNAQGKMISESKYAGKNFRDANKDAIEHLTRTKAMLHAEWKVHTYPLCWRSKVPLVYRTTEQWYIRRSQYTKAIVEENKKVKWYPDFAQTSFNNLMSDAGDWAISRQRFWGTPLPIFEDEEGHYEVIGSKEELEEKVYQKLEDLHLDNLAKLSYEKNGKIMKHVGYTTDVWFDSGCASFASHYEEGLTFDQILEKYYPARWITESEDQVRGWFSSLFNVGFMVTDKAPYRELLYYKFVMDKNGQKMSKSLGNGISGNEAIELWGADVTRYYLLTKRAPEDQINFDPEEIPLVQSFFTTLENIFKLLGNYLEEHTLSRPSLQVSSLDVEDKWILARMNRTIQVYTRAMENYKMNVAFKELEDFVTRDFSRTYLKLVKERMENRDEELLALTNELLKKVLVLLTPACPYFSEELYQKTPFETKKESILLEDLPEVDEITLKELERENIEENFELAQEVIQAALAAREKAKIGVRWPLSALSLGSTAPLEGSLKNFEVLIRKITNIQDINYTLDDVDMEYIVKPNFAGIKKDFEDVSSVVKCINTNKYYIVQDLKRGTVGGEYEGVQLDFEKHLLKEALIKGDFVSSDFSKGTLVLDTKQDEILLEEGYLRELVRRVQDMRKNLGLEKHDFIELSFEGSSQYYLDLISNCENSIKKRVGAKDILEKKVRESETFQIKDEVLVVSMRKVVGE